MAQTLLDQIEYLSTSISGSLRLEGLRFEGLFQQKRPLFVTGV